MELENEICDSLRVENQVAFEYSKNEEDNINEESHVNMSHVPSEQSYQEEFSQQRQIENSPFNSSTNSGGVSQSVQTNEK